MHEDRDQELYWVLANIQPTATLPAHLIHDLRPVPSQRHYPQLGIRLCIPHTLPPERIRTPTHAIDTKAILQLAVRPDNAQHTHAILHEPTLHGSQNRLLLHGMRDCSVGLGNDAPVGP